MTVARAQEAVESAGFVQDDIAVLERLESQVRWLSTWMIHNANHVRLSRDGLKVGGHQASCASMTTLMSALYFHVLSPRDRVAVKPHASPVFHAIQYLLGRQSKEQLQHFRALGGAQSYPSRTKDKDDVDFSTGSVGMGVALTAFASLVQDYLSSHGALASQDMGRMIALLGDAELDEGNIYEALIETYKHKARNVWWIVDYNRQSLDAITSDRMFNRFDDIFESAKWDVITLKYGKAQEAAFARPGGAALRNWIDTCPNALYAALTFQGGAAWRAQLLNDIGAVAGVKKLLSQYDDAALAALMTQLGGHCMETLLEAFDGITDDRPKLFIAYTVKGYGLPLQGHKDNHSGLMNTAQVETLRASMGIDPGKEWEKLGGVLPAERHNLQDFLSRVPFAQDTSRRHLTAQITVPVEEQFPAPQSTKESTQAAFGKILNELARSDTELAANIVTTSPDVTVSTNLGGWVNQRGIYSRTEQADVFREANIASAQKWVMSASGQHIELGIAENNLFVLLAALGLSHSLFGARLLPIGTLYDPFIARGLDALNYAAYQDARFMVVATPSGITLGPEGGAHQSITSPLIGMAQPGLVTFEPAYIDELSHIMRWAFGFMQADNGGAVYLRLTTRAIDQAQAPRGKAWPGDLLKGAYWHVPPAPGAELAIVYTGAIAPEAIAAHEQILEDVPGAGLLAIPSADLLHRDWTRARRGPWTGEGAPVSHIDHLLAPLAPDAGLVTVTDGAPHSLSWLGGVKGHRVMPLGVEAFGQSGDLVDLYHDYRIDADAILDACASVYLRR